MPVIHVYKTNGVGGCHVCLMQDFDPRKMVHIEALNLEAAGKLESAIVGALLNYAKAGVVSDAGYVLTDADGQMNLGYEQESNLARGTTAADGDGGEMTTS